MRVFLSYGHADDQVTALRLQVLGAAEGLSVYVPPLSTRTHAAYTALPFQPSIPAAGPEWLSELNGSDIVLGLIGRGWSDACRNELEIGLKLGKRLVILCDRAVLHGIPPSLSSHAVPIDLANPEETLTRVIRDLKQIGSSQVAPSALLALVALAFGLLVIGAAKKS